MFAKLFDVCVSNSNGDWDAIGASLKVVLQARRAWVQFSNVKGTGPIGGPCELHEEQVGCFAESPPVLGGHRRAHGPGG